MGQLTKNTSRRTETRRELFRRLSDAALLLQLETGEMGIRRIVSHELGRRRTKEAVPLLVRCLQSADAQLREAAADALGMIGDLGAGPSLLELFSDGTQPAEIRDTCAYALARLAYSPALPKLLAGLSDPSPSVRACVVAALSILSASGVRSAVELAYAVERDEQVRRAMKDLLDSCKEGPAKALHYASLGSGSFATHKYQASDLFLPALVVEQREPRWFGEIASATTVQFPGEQKSILEQNSLTVAQN